MEPGNRIAEKADHDVSVFGPEQWALVMVRDVAKHLLYLSRIDLHPKQIGI
jgi:hypothetical protein